MGYGQRELPLSRSVNVFEHHPQRNLSSMCGHDAIQRNERDLPLTTKPMQTLKMQESVQGKSENVAFFN